MTDQVTYSGRWVGDDYAGLPGASVRALGREDRAERKAAEEREAHRSDRLEQAAFRAEQDGRDVSLGGVFARALRASVKTDREADKADLRAKVESGEVEDLTGTLTRSARDTGYETDRLIRQAEDNHRWMVAYEARRNYPAALEATRAQSRRAHSIERQQGTFGGSLYQPEITRGFDDGIFVR